MADIVATPSTVSGQEWIMQVPVRLSKTSSVPVTVNYITRDGTAIAGTDYVSTAGSLTWAVGQLDRHLTVTTLEGANAGTFYVDLSMPVEGRLAKPIGSIALTAGSPPTPGGDLYDEVLGMLNSHWGYIQRATGDAAVAANMPVLITEEGLVKNSQQPGGALGGYTADGVASSEGISLMMRGIGRAYQALGGATRLDFIKFLFNANCTYFHFGTRPPATNAEFWYHTWMVNAGEPFAVRGPLAENGRLDQGGFINQPNVFTTGRAVLNPPPDIVYQVVTDGTEFVWQNVFADIVGDTGNRLSVNYYITAAGVKVSGAQTGGSFGQPQIPPGAPGNENPIPGEIVLVSPLSGTMGVNYCVTVPGTLVDHGEVYEAWPMWRQLAPEERSIAGDAIHWYADFYRLMKIAEPTNADWTNALNRTLDVWQKTCNMESAEPFFFKAGTEGDYNNFPLTYSYGYGRTNVDDESTNWDALPPTSKYAVTRTSDALVTFVAPAEHAEPESGDSVRYGIAFENSPLYLTYTDASTISTQTKGSRDMAAIMAIESQAGEVFEGVIRIPGGETITQSLKLKQFYKFQSTPGDATGDKTGDWTGDEEWVPPEYDAVPFPGPRAGLIGDSITYQNIMQFNAIDGYLAYYSFGQAGWFNYAMELCNHRLELEPGLQPNDDMSVNSGYNWGIAGSRVSDWWEESFQPLGPDTPLEEGPMWNYLKYKDKVDCVSILGGTNDLAGNRPAAEVFLNLKKAAYQCASDGKWVYIQTIMPRTTDLLTGYTLAQQDTIRNRIIEVNANIRQWFADVAPANMFLVDTYPLLVGPNNIDPHGWISDRSNPSGTSIPGNWRPGEPQLQWFGDGLHPATAGAYVIGKKLSEIIIASGVPARSGYNLGGPLTAGSTNLLGNPTFAVTTTFPAGGQSSRLGRSIGLGDSLTDSSHARPAGIPVINNLGLGYVNGNVPDYWFLYRSSNLDNESYSNFGAYTWQALVGEYPEAAPYMVESTWATGALKSSIINLGGKPAWKIEFTTPTTGTKNESFVIRTTVPHGANGPWNSYGFATWPKTENPVNTQYVAGDKIGAEATVQLSNIVGLHTLRMSANFLGTDDVAISAGEIQTSYAIISGLGMGQNFWPPSIIDIQRYHTESRTIQLKTPIVTAPTVLSSRRPYLQLNIEVGTDASVAGSSVTLIITDPRVLKFTGPAL